MGVLITGVKKDSAARRFGLRSGDVLIGINGNDITDVLDYRFHMTNEKLSVAFSRGNKTFIRKIVKKPYEDLGLEFSTYLMDNQRSCRNKCIFCFIDQLPQGMRESLYFKDDDSRLSFLFGNYITLTNITEHEIRRIIDMRISPVNISVHTTNPELRCKMMGNRFAGERLSVMQRFASAGIRMNCQLVLCPGINDGQELERTLNDLSKLVPSVESVAVVPVGLTKYRQSLDPLRPYTAEQAKAVVDLVEMAGESMTRRHGFRVFYPADEFFLKAGMPIPQAGYYDNFSQLENGVGLMALLNDEFDKALKNRAAEPRGSRIALATGVAAAPFLNRLIDKARRRWNTLNVEVVPVGNEFFGELIDVAGLVTGRDLIKKLDGINCDLILIPSVMLRREGDLFLDDVSVEDVKKALNASVAVVQVDGGKLADAIML